MQASRSKPISLTQANLWVDLALFAALLLALAPQFTGLAIHEWLSLALAGGALVHLLLHWGWIVGVLRRFLGGTSWAARFNFVLNALLFVNFIIVTFTGILISREAMPLFGIVLQASRMWEQLHRLSADAIVFISALHVAVHWRWILSALRRYIVNPVLSLRRARPPQPAPVRVEVER